MRLGSLAIAALLSAFATSSSAWDGFVCNYSTKTVTVHFDVAASEPFSQTVQPETNSAARSIAGLCFGDITAWVAQDNTAVKVDLIPFGTLIQACSNRVVMLFDVPGKATPVGYTIFSTPGISPADNCLQD